MMSNTFRTAVAIGALVTLAACGGDDATDAPATTDAPSTTDAPATAGTEAPDDGADGAVITIADFAFDGATEVPVGTTVVVTNTDRNQHTWSAVDGTFDSGSIGPDDSFEFTFTEAGEFAYFCNFHPSMTGTIVVTG